MTNVEKALRLAALGIHVFPFTITKSGRKVPCIKAEDGGRGHRDATTDPEQIATWFSLDYPHALIGVHAGASGLLCADVDEKNGKSGSGALSDAWLTLSDTFVQNTPTGGQHYIYRAPEGKNLAPAGNYQHVEGLDIRAGSSWFGWYTDEIPESMEVFAPAPEWLCEEAEDRVGGSFEGGLDEWLATLDSASDEPDDRVLDAIQRIPTEDFDHTVLIERQFELVRLAAEGHPGVRHALDILRSEWLRGEYNTPDYAYDFDAGLDGAIRKYGALDEMIANLPAYTEALESALSAGLETDLIFGAGKPKEHYFRVLRELARLGVAAETAASVVWSAPSTKSWAREWGIEYLYQQYEIAVREAESRVAPRENPAEESPFNEGPVDYSLLTQDEREILKMFPTFIDRYMDWVHRRLKKYNPPYHRAAAWTILSLVYGPTSFIPVTETKKLGLNLFLMCPGGSSSGKSDSVNMRNAILRSYFPDGEYNVGADNVSPEMLHEVLIKHDKRAVFFNADEAAAYFMKIAGKNSTMAPVAPLVTKAYDGYVEPITKRVSKDLIGKSAIVSLTSQFYATPDRLFSFLDEGQFLDGMLARYLWSWGHEVELTRDSFRKTQVETMVEDVEDPMAIGFVREFQTLVYRGGRFPAIGEPDALDRLSANDGEMYERLRHHPQWNILKSPLLRMQDAIWKCAALIAIADGRRRYTLPDVLAAIAQAEEWLAGLVRAVEMVSASQFSRDVEEIAAYVKAHPAGVTDTRLYDRFRKYELKEYLPRVDAAVRRGLIRRVESGKVDKYFYNTGGEE